MKILLLNPPQTCFPGSSGVTAGLPLGIMYIAAVLEQEGYDVEILDALIADSPPFREGDATQYGMSWEKIRGEITQRKPDMVGISCPFTTQIDNTIKVSEIVKDIDPGILTIVGGPHTSVRATEFLENAQNVDVAVIGEGEYTMVEIARYFEGKRNLREIQGIAYRKGVDIVSNPKTTFIRNIDELPFPAYHLVDMESYLNPKRIRYRGAQYLRLKGISMITSRGCVYNCVFCSIHLHMGKIWRAHSEEYVTNHIEYVVNNYGVELIHFEDDNLTLNTKRFEGILDRVMGKEIRFSWDVPNGIRADRLSKDLLSKMKKAGCVELTIGVESGDQFILDNVIDKHLRLEDVIELAIMCRQLKIPLAAFYVVGFPGETQGNIQQTIDFALMLKKEYDVYMCIMVATPLYGTRLYEICKDKGYFSRELTPRAFSEGTLGGGAGLIKTEDFAPDEIKKLVLNAISVHARISILRYFRNPKRAFILVTKSHEAAIRSMKNAIRI